MLGARPLTPVLGESLLSFGQPLRGRDGDRVWIEPVAGAHVHLDGLVDEHPGRRVDGMLERRILALQPGREPALAPG